MKATRKGSKGPVEIERRSGMDRRQKDVGGPNGRERRTSLETRKPEVVELDLTPSEWAALDCGDLREGVRTQGSGA
jgi:hypothetical protein